jgi:hypothetical protein
MDKRKSSKGKCGIEEGKSFIAFDGKQKKEKTIVKTQTISLGSFVCFTHEEIPDLPRRQLTHSVSTLK